MNNFILYSGLNFDYLPSESWSGNWQKSARYFTDWLNDAVDSGLDRLIEASLDPSDLDQARRDLSIFGGNIIEERKAP